STLAQSPVGETPRELPGDGVRRRGLVAGAVRHTVAARCDRRSPRRPGGRPMAGRGIPVAPAPPVRGGRGDGCRRRRGRGTGASVATPCRPVPVRTARPPRRRRPGVPVPGAGAARSL